MTAECTCQTRGRTVAEDTVEGDLGRARAHDHDHHGEQEAITPEPEARLRAAVRRSG